MERHDQFLIMLHFLSGSDLRHEKLYPNLSNSSLIQGQRVRTLRITVRHNQLPEETTRMKMTMIKTTI